MFCLCAYIIARLNGSVNLSFHDALRRDSLRKVVDICLAQLAGAPSKCLDDFPEKIPLQQDPSDGTVMLLDTCRTHSAHTSHRTLASAHLPCRCLSVQSFYSSMFCIGTLQCCRNCPDRLCHMHIRIVATCSPCLVRRAGFEPATIRLEGGGSILLS